jgi:hypothetical protein
LAQDGVQMDRFSDRVGAEKPVGDFGENGAEVNILHDPKGLRGLEFPEMLETLTGRAGVASVLRLSPPKTFALYSHSVSFSGVHVLFPGEDRSVYVTTWVDDAGGALDRKSVELILFRAWQKWGLSVSWHSLRRFVFPTESTHRSRLETLEREGWPR